MSIGTSRTAPAACTESSHTPCSRASRLTTRGCRPVSVTGRVHCSSRLDVALMSRGRPGTRRRPSVRRSCRPGRSRDGVGWLSRQLQPFDTLGHDRFDDRSDDSARRRPAPSAANTATVGGIADASESIIVGSDAAGTQRTRAVDGRPFACGSTSSRGTIEPCATTRTPSRATRPSQRMLVPRPSRLDRR